MNEDIAKNQASIEDNKTLIDDIKQSQILFTQLIDFVR